MSLLATIAPALLANAAPGIAIVLPEFDTPADDRLLPLR